MPRLAAHLPDALVALAPPGRGRVGAGHEEPPGVVVDVVEVVAQLVGGAEQLAVDVDLLLVPGAVADAHRAAVPPALQVRQRSLGEVVLTTDAEHDLQAVVVVHRRGSAGHEREEVDGLVGAGGDPSACIVKLASRTQA